MERRNVALAAAAPDAVAELVRLRRVLEEQRDKFLELAEADSWMTKFSTVPLIPFYRKQANLIAHVLNGDNDDPA